MTIRAVRLRRCSWKDGERYLVEITPLHPLPLVNLRSTDTLIDLHLDARISIGDDYEACQKWALAFYSNWAEVCGIRYAPRKANEATSNVALFTERCRSKFTYASLGQLKHLENIVLLATDRYRRLSAEFLAPGSFLR